jgi:membrane-bound serine protease (ClpP class)
VVEHTLSVRQKFLRILVDPNVAYLLMLLGIYGIFFELSNPGSILPGILGGISVLLALFAFQALPVDYTGLGLILLGVILFILEVKVPSYGVLTVGGLTALVLGSLMLFDSPDQWARVSLRVIIPSVLVLAGFFLVCVMLAIRGQKRRVVTGKEALVGTDGRVVTAIGGGDRPGKIIVHGEVWDAVAAGPAARDTRVRVVQIEGRLLSVEVLASLPADEIRQPDSPTRS